MKRCMSNQSRIPRIALLLGIAVLMVLAGSFGCDINTPTSNALVGRWKYEQMDLALTYWFYSNGTIHRETSIDGSTSCAAGYYSATDTTLNLHFIGSTPDAPYPYSIDGDVLWIDSGEMGSIPLLKQATLDKPANNVPSVTVDGGDASVIAGSSASFSISVDHADALQTLEYQWFVDDVLQDGANTDTFFYEVPASGGATQSIEVVVTDQYDLATGSATLSVTPAHFKKWDGTSWLSIGVDPPAGTVDSFAYNGNLTVRLSNNELWTYSAGWSQLGFSAPAGTVQATSIDYSGAGSHLVLTRDSTGQTYFYDTSSSAWINITGAIPTLPSGTEDFFITGSGGWALLSSGTIQWTNAGAPFIDYGNPAAVPDAHIGIGDYNSSLSLFVLTSAGKIYTTDGTDPVVWTDSAISAPAETLDVFLYGGTFTIRW